MYGRTVIITVQSTVYLQLTFTELPHVTTLQHPINLTKEEYDVFDCTDPPSLISISHNECFVRLPLLSCNELLSCVQRFRERVPRGCKVKSAYDDASLPSYVLFTFSQGKVGGNSLFLVVPRNVLSVRGGFAPKPPSIVNHFLFPLSCEGRRIVVS